MIFSKVMLIWHRCDAIMYMQLSWLCGTEILPLQQNIIYLAFLILNV